LRAGEGESARGPHGRPLSIFTTGSGVYIGVAVRGCLVKCCGTGVCYVSREEGHGETSLRYGRALGILNHCSMRLESVLQGIGQDVMAKTLSFGGRNRHRIFSFIQHNQETHPPELLPAQALSLPCEYFHTNAHMPPILQKVINPQTALP
jgi:hypothetical protein